MNWSAPHRTVGLLVFTLSLCMVTAWRDYAISAVAPWTALGGLMLFLYHTKEEGRPEFRYFLNGYRALAIATMLLLLGVVYFGDILSRTIQLIAGGLFLLGTFFHWLAEKQMQKEIRDSKLD